MTIGFTISIDGEDYSPPDQKMTVNSVLNLAGLPPEEYYLVEIHGKSQKPYEGEGDKKINLHEGSKFVSVYIGPTTVADGPHAMMGSALFTEGLRKLGYEATELPSDHIKFSYVVEVGKYAGLELVMGFVVPSDFPLNPPHGIHIDVDIHPIGGSGGHPTGGIHRSQPGHSQYFGPEWQHWSRPHPSWAEGNRTVACYMAFVRTLWATQ